MSDINTNETPASNDPLAPPADAGAQAVTATKAKNAPLVTADELKALEANEQVKAILDAAADLGATAGAGTGLQAKLLLKVSERIAGGKLQHVKPARGKPKAGSAPNIYNAIAQRYENARKTDANDASELAKSSLKTMAAACAAVGEATMFVKSLGAVTGNRSFYELLLDADAARTAVLSGDTSNREVRRGLDYLSQLAREQVAPTVKNGKEHKYNNLLPPEKIEELMYAPQRDKAEPTVRSVLADVAKTIDALLKAERKDGLAIEAADDEKDETTDWNRAMKARDLLREIVRRHDDELKAANAEAEAERDAAKAEADAKSEAERAEQVKASLSEDELLALMKARGMNIATVQSTPAPKKGKKAA